jgi:hypothetical protein
MARYLRRADFCVFDHAKVRVNASSCENPKVIVGDEALQVVALGKVTYLVRLTRIAAGSPSPSGYEDQAAIHRPLQPVSAGAG